MTEFLAGGLPRSRRVARAAEERPGVSSHQEIGAVNLEIAVPAENRLVRFAIGPRRKLAQLAVLHLWQRTQSPALVLRFLLSFSLYLFSEFFSLFSANTGWGGKRIEGKLGVTYRNPLAFPTK